MKPEWKHEVDFMARGYEIDSTGRITVSAMCSYLEEAANQHAALLKYPVERLVAEGKTWVLTRFYIELYSQMPECGVVKVRTWPVDVGRLLFRRDFELYEGDGEKPFGIAVSQWAIVNLDTRRAEKIPAEMISALSPENPDRVCDEPSWKISSQAANPRLLKFRARMADIDRNSHVNNVRYLDWVIESAPSAHNGNMRLKSLEILYKAEAVYNDTIYSHGCVDDDGDSFLHGLIHQDGRELVRAKTKWVAK